MKIIKKEMKKCIRCHGEGMYCPSIRVKCEKCGGTGRGIRGGVGGCKECYGDGTKWAKGDKEEQCPQCKGVGKEKETKYDHCRQDVWATLNFSVIRQDRGVSFNEAYLGIGTCFTCADYGSAWEKNDEQIIEDVRNRRGCQYLNFCEEDEDNFYAKDILIVVNKGGFRVIPKGGDMGDRELGEEEGMITGSIIAVGGGNGTIAAATMKK